MLSSLAGRVLQLVVCRQQVFSELWGTNELLSSFDSINLARPGKNEAAGLGWLHVDQAPLRRGLFCIQGLVNLVDVGPDTTGGLPQEHLAGKANCVEYRTREDGSGG